MPTNSYHLGLSSEDAVLKHYQNLGFILLKRRWRSPFAEVDLLMKARNPSRLILLEVKRNVFTPLRHLILSRRQKQRLRRTAQFLNDQGWLVELKLIVVEEDGEIAEIPDVFVDV